MPWDSISWGLLEMQWIHILLENKSLPTTPRIWDPSILRNIQGHGTAKGLEGPSSSDQKRTMVSTCLKYITSELLIILPKWEGKSIQIEMFDWRTSALSCWTVDNVYDQDATADSSICSAEVVSPAASARDPLLRLGWTWSPTMLQQMIFPHFAAVLSEANISLRTSYTTQAPKEPLGPDSFQAVDSSVRPILKKPSLSGNR